MSEAYSRDDRARTHGGSERPAGLLSMLVMRTIEAYQRISPHVKRPSCRFYPSCSEYTRQAVVRYGAARGLVRGARRVLRCHPFNPGGYDPVE